MGWLDSNSSVTSTTQQAFSPPDWTIDPWKSYTQASTQLAAQGLPIYSGQTVAPLSQQQQLGIGQLTSMGTQGTPFGNTAASALQGIAGGNVNPYATQTNPYMGSNPYLDNLIGQSNQRITDAYSKGTAAQMAAAQAKAGAFGGSGAQEADMLANRALGDALSQNTSNILGQNYYNSGQLAESALNRATGAYSNAVGQQIGAASQAPQFNQSNLQGIQAYMGGGQQVQDYMQQLLSAGQNLFSQYQQAPWQIQDLLGNALSRASGVGGSSTSTLFGPGTTWGQGLLGTGLLGGALYNTFKGG